MEHEQSLRMHARNYVYQQGGCMDLQRKGRVVTARERFQMSLSLMTADNMLDMYRHCDNSEDEPYTDCNKKKYTIRKSYF